MLVNSIKNIHDFQIFYLSIETKIDIVKQTKRPFKAQQNLITQQF